MEETALQIDGVPYYSVQEVKTVLEKLSRQLATNNVDAAKILISHCLEKLNQGELLCDIK
jgi:hypothetical protein